MQEIGRLLMLAGVVLLVCGAALMLAGRLPWLGRLPGDIVVERENVRIHAPIVTMMVISLVLTVVINLIARLWR